MRIKIKQVDWSGWNGGSSNEKNLEYDIQLKKEIVVKSMQFTAVKKSLFQRSTWIEKIFVFKVVEVGANYVTIQTNGTAGGEFDRTKKKYLAQTVTIKLGEKLTFSTKTMDAGSSFEMSIVE